MSGSHDLTEHSDHPLDRRVAMTMVIVAACLAFVSLLGHQTENEVLRLQTEYASLKVQESNAWAQYQSKRMRQHTNENAILMLSLLATQPAGDAERTKKLEQLRLEAIRYSVELRGVDSLSQEELALLRATGTYENARAETPLDAKAKEFAEQATRAKERSEFRHHQAERFDAAHLLIELGLVLCSICVLTKRKAFWLVGIVCTVVGVGLAMSVIWMHPHHAADPTSHPVLTKSVSALSLRRHG